jgi:DNA repair protein RadD
VVSAAFALRPYQHELVNAVAAAFGGGARSVVMQLGTGGGKTATASSLLERSIAKGFRAVFLAHLDSLLEDTAERLRSSGLRTGFVQAGRPVDPCAPIQVCSLQTLHARGERPPCDLLILDECHRAQGASVRGVLDAYPRAWLLGLTAVPQRGDAKPLGDVFDRLVTGPSNRWLTEQGYLVPCDVLAPAAYSDAALVDNPVAAYAKHAPGSRAIVFAANVSHAEELTAGFNAAGFAARCVTGETSREERRAVRRVVTLGEVLVLVSVGCFVEGFDLPAIETVILARGFTVTGAFLQGIGRGLRPCPETGKTRCTVIDLRGSVHLHGLPDEDRIWSLTGKAVRRSETITALRRCSECLAIFRPAARCPRCGVETVAAARIPRVLTRAEKLHNWSAVPAAQRDASYLRRLESVATTRMHLPPARARAWALEKFARTFKRTPVAA